MYKFIIDDKSRNRGRKNERRKIKTRETKPRCCISSQAVFLERISGLNYDWKKRFPSPPPFTTNFVRDNKYVKL